MNKIACFVLKKQLIYNGIVVIDKFTQVKSSGMLTLTFLINYKKFSME